MSRHILFSGTLQTVQQRKEDALATISLALNELRIIKGMTSSTVFMSERQRQERLDRLKAEIKRAQEDWDAAVCEEIMEE